jgi:hypothetical protein
VLLPLPLLLPPLLPLLLPLLLLLTLLLPLPLPLPCPWLPLASPRLSPAARGRAAAGRSWRRAGPLPPPLLLLPRRPGASSAAPPPTRRLLHAIAVDTILTLGFLTLRGKITRLLLYAFSLLTLSCAQRRGTACRQRALRLACAAGRRDGAAAADPAAPGARGGPGAGAAGPCIGGAAVPRTCRLPSDLFLRL